MMIALLSLALTLPALVLRRVTSRPACPVTPIRCITAFAWV